MPLFFHAMLLATTLFHAQLKSSFPARDAIVDRPPGKVILTFTESVNSVVAGISILKPDSTEVLKLKLGAAKDAESLEAPIPTPLMPGKYLVRWHTSSVDGHAVKGVFAFTIKPHA